MCVFTLGRELKGAAEGSDEHGCELHSVVQRALSEMSERDPDLTRPVPVALAELIARRLVVLGDPVRVRLLDHLDLEGEMPVGVLAAVVGVSRYHASQQLAVLRSAGVVRRRRKGRLACYSVVDRAPLEVFERVAVSLEAQIEGLRGRLSGVDDQAGG